jgi:hypothetical protein
MGFFRRFSTGKDGFMECISYNGTEKDALTKVLMEFHGIFQDGLAKVLWDLMG